MNNQTEIETLFELGETVRGLLQENQQETCEEIVRAAMGQYPDAAQPHNLFGIILEKRGDHAGAMRHFRAAWALDPTFTPSRKNMDQYGSFCVLRVPAYTENDCQDTQKGSNYKVEYDEKGIGHVVRRKER